MYFLAFEVAATVALLIGHFAAVVCDPNLRPWSGA
jgi:hypothetical protein